MHLKFEKEYATKITFSNIALAILNFYFYSLFSYCSSNFLIVFALDLFASFFLYRFYSLVHLFFSVLLIFGISSLLLLSIALTIVFTFTTIATPLVIAFPFLKVLAKSNKRTNIFIAI